MLPPHIASALQYTRGTPEPNQHGVDTFAQKLLMDVCTVHHTITLERDLLRWYWYSAVDTLDTCMSGDYVGTETPEGSLCSRQLDNLICFCCTYCSSNPNASGVQNKPHMYVHTSKYKYSYVSGTVHLDLPATTMPGRRRLFTPWRRGEALLVYWFQRVGYRGTATSSSCSLPLFCLLLLQYYFTMHYGHQSVSSGGGLVRPSGLASYEYTPGSKYPNPSQRVPDVVRSAMTLSVGVSEKFQKQVKAWPCLKRQSKVRLL